MQFIGIVKLLFMMDIASAMQDKNLLIIEDDLVSNLFFQELFSKKVKQVFTANSGTDAIKILKSHPSIDIVLLDLKLPDANGLDVVPLIKKIAPQAIIIAQTAYAHDIIRNQAFLAGCDDYITKPVRSTELFNLILKHFS
jgi:CheY-like chemotaxis protein